MKKMAIDTKKKSLIFMKGIVGEGVSGFSFPAIEITGLS